MAPPATFRLVALLAITLAALAAPAVAGEECAKWTTGFHLSGPDGGAFNDVSAGPLATYDDGSGAALYMGGHFDRIDGEAATSLARWDGSHWSAVPCPLERGVLALCVFDGGAGPALHASGPVPTGGPQHEVWRWNGASWTRVGDAFNARITTLATFDDGGGAKLFAGGEFSSVAGTDVRGIARWNGAAWASIGDVQGSVAALAVHDDGSGPALYVGGHFTAAASLPALDVARFDGASWSAVGSGLGGYVLALESCDLGGGARLYAGGRFASNDEIAAWDGATWSPVGNGNAGYSVNALEAFDDGTGIALYAGGDFSDAGGTAANNVARWDGTSWSALGSGVVQQPDGGWATALRAHDDGHGARLFVTGVFTTAGGAPANRVALWDGATWGALTPSAAPNGLVQTFETWDDGNGAALYAGGSFSGVDEASNGVVRFAADDWSALGGGLPGGNVFDLAVYDDGAGEQLYAGGEFDDPSGAGGTIHLARWNGHAWSAVPGGVFDGPVYALGVFDAGGGSELYVGGAFTSVGALAASAIAKWNGSAWTDVGGGVQNTLYPQLVSVNAFCAFDDGGGPALFFGGQFDGYVRKWDGATLSPLGAGLAGNASFTRVRSLVAWDDGHGSALFAGGNFVGSGAVPCVFIGRWDGVAWSTVGSGTNGDVHALSVYDDGTGNGTALYAGGTFTDASGIAASRVACWDGTSWSALSNGVSSPSGTASPLVAAFGVVAADLYLGGRFQSADDVPSNNVASWQGCRLTGELYCFGDGSGAPCPCGNSSMPGERLGCTSSLGVGASLRATGRASLSDDRVVLHAAEMPNGSALFFQGTERVAGGAGVAFGDGLRCAGGTVRRLATITPSSGASRYPGSGDASVSVRGGVLVPGVRTYQVRYRNAASFCTSESFNFTNGVEVPWSP